ncbi:MAG: DUF2807 domain-containing protein [Sphingopyxis sp.]
MNFARTLPRAAIAIVLLTLAAGPASANTRRYGLTSFDRIEVLGDMIVEIVPDYRISAVAEASRSALETLSLEVQDRTLRVRQVAEGAFGPRRAADGPIRIRLRAPALQQVVLRGSGQVDAGPLRGSAIAIDVDGPGHVRASVSRGETIRLRVVGTGEITISGRARDMTAITNGAGSIHAGALAVRDLTVRSSGSGSSHFAASHSANIIAGGSANVDVTGHARCEVRNIGAGTVACGAASRAPLPTTAG